MSRRKQHRRRQLSEQLDQVPPVIRKLKQLSGLIYSDSSGRVKSKLPAVLVDHSVTTATAQLLPDSEQLQSQPFYKSTQHKVSTGRGGPPILTVS
jgi:hypothetical protein